MCLSLGVCVCVRERVCVPVFKQTLAHCFLQVVKAGGCWELVATVMQYVDPLLLGLGFAEGTHGCMLAKYTPYAAVRISNLFFTIFFYGLP